jgi:hypothetical protein
MKALLRTIFVVLLILTLATQTIRIARQSQSEDVAALSDGLVKLRAKVITAPSPDQIVAEVPGCSQPLIISRVSFAGTNEAMLNVPVEKWGQRYIYLGTVDSRLDFAKLLSRWVKSAALATLGLRKTAAPGSVVQVLLPKECPDLIDRDWSVLSPSS